MRRESRCAPLPSLLVLAVIAPKLGTLRLCSSEGIADEDEEEGDGDERESK
jgi:hypothetical protein